MTGEAFILARSALESVQDSTAHGFEVLTALRSNAPPLFTCPEQPSKLDSFKDEMHRLLKDDPEAHGVRARELIEPLGFCGGKTIVDDTTCARCGRCPGAADASADGVLT